MRDVFDIWVRQVSKKLLSLTIATTLSVMQAVRSQEEEKERKRISTKKSHFADQLTKKHHPMKHHPHASKDKRAMRCVGL